MKLKMGANKYDVPKGTYRAKFLGAFERAPMAGTDFGPGLEWRFEILEGPSTGKLASRTTGQDPSAKNSCGRMLSGITGGEVNKDQVVDLDQYKGRLYTVLLESNQAGTGTRVGSIVPYDGPAPAPAPRSTVGGPPPRRNQAVVAPTKAEDRFWVVTSNIPEAQPEELGWLEMERFCHERELDPAKVEVCKVGTDLWKYAADFGVQSIKF